MEYIYVILERSHTLLGKLSRLVDPYEYTHITISLSPELDKFYSFSRLYHYAPFLSGFMRETLDCYAYGKHEKVKLKVFKVPVTVHEKNNIKAFIKKVHDDRKNYVFNLYSALTMGIFKGFRIYKTYNCMSFTARILEMTQSVGMDRPYYKYSIEDMDDLLSDYKYDEREFARKEIGSPKYMRKIDPLFNIGSFVRLNGILLYRMIFVSPDKDEL